MTEFFIVAGAFIFVWALVLTVGWDSIRDLWRK